MPFWRCFTMQEDGMRSFLLFFTYAITQHTYNFLTPIPAGTFLFHLLHSYIDQCHRTSPQNSIIKELACLKADVDPLVLTDFAYPNCFTICSDLLHCSCRIMERLEKSDLILWKKRKKHSACQLIHQISVPASYDTVMVTKVLQMEICGT
ncbi:hypothetical protein EJ08DRAFT_46545 [Tothia fuscella]|uniref:Uncharacterized protein n=1 Tax=Tothia fuscella TaxID=1048955 RepID=A0A9P4NFP5_9PEZI|nr:hypothetical protein EJ08DRAFT_46545 [Tothia fuscella]